MIIGWRGCFKGVEWEADLTSGFWSDFRSVAQEASLKHSEESVLLTIIGLLTGQMASVCNSVSVCHSVCQCVC